MKWLEILEAIGPAVLLCTPLAPLAPLVIAGIKTAEALPNASGAQKKALVQQIVNLGAQGANAAAGKALIDPQVASTAAGTAIDTVVAVTNLAQQAHAVNGAA